MKFTSFFTRTNTKKLKYPLQNKARNEIDAYLKCVFATSYVAFESAGLLELFIDDSELIYNDTFEMLKEINHKTNAYSGEEDKIANYNNIALSIVFQDISKKLHIDDYQ